MVANANQEERCDASWLRFEALLGHLIAQANQGDGAAFERLYLASASWLLSRIRRFVRDGQAEDVLAEVYLQAWGSLHSFDAARGAATTWLSMIARSRALDHLRYERARPQTDAGDSVVACEAGEEPDNRLSRAQDARKIRDSIDLLKSEERLVVGLAYFKECTQAEIAISMGLPIGTVKSLMSRAQRKLKIHFISMASDALLAE